MAEQTGIDKAMELVENVVMFDEDGEPMLNTSASLRQILDALLACHEALAG